LSGVPSNLAASLQNFASPRAAQLARVIGEWRATPVRRSSQSSFLSGLMTPPATNIRRTPEPETAESQPIASASSSQLNLGQPLSSRRQEKSKADLLGSSLQGPFPVEPPRTPPLLHQGAYDDDAEARFGFSDDDESMTEGTPRRPLARFQHVE